jgi:putative transposase
MRSRYKVVEPGGTYFLTATVVEWIPVFIGKEACDIIVDALAYCRAKKSLRVYAYVVMENHIHLVADAPDLSRTLQAFKRHTASEIVSLAERSKKDWLLNQFAYYKKRYKTTSRYQVWQEGLHPQLIQGQAMMHQKIAYIHDNPVRLGYVDVPEHWRYSSARNYMCEDHSVMDIDYLHQ